ncbi:synaptic vesicle transporter [Hortaea werneckii]|nr:synaptic vesicle transporter [Hortaea werneckii]
MNADSQRTSRMSSVYDEKDVEKGDESRPDSIAADSQEPGPHQQNATTQPAFTGAANEAHQEPPPKCDDFDSPDDPGNPLNWPLWKKWYHTFIPASIALVCTLGSSIYTPGREDVMREFGVSREVSLLPYVLYVLGLACGPMLAAPTSEQLGRRAVYLVAIPIFALFILGSGFSQSIAALTICRFFAGVFGSPGLSIGSATLSDIWRPNERAVPMAIYVTTPFLGPAIGPLVGGYAVWAYGWRWTEWVLLFFTVAGLTPAAGMNETYKSAILKKRAKERGLPPKQSGRTPLQAAAFFAKSTLTRPIHMTLVEPVVGLFTAYVAINFAMLYAFFAAFPYVFEQIYGFGIRSTGLTFLGLGAGCIVGCALIITFSKLIFKRQVQKSIAAGQGGKVNPEARLYPAMIGSICLPVSLFWFGWSAQSSAHWMAPVVAEAVFGCGNLLIFMSATLYLMDFYGPLYGASAMGSNNLARYVLGTAFPLFVVQMYERLGIGWATSLLAFISLACTPIPWCFYVWGPKLRGMSKYQRSS